MRCSYVILLPALLAGCAHEVQVVTVDPAKKCEAAPTLLQACETAPPIAADVTYGQLLDGYLADRQRLRRCAAQRDDLAKALETCNAAIDRHNAELAQRMKAVPPR
jgi:hypothetical protein